MLAWFVLIASAAAQELETSTAHDHENHIEPPEAELAGTELVLAFAMFRHGDRTPDLDEVTLYPHKDRNSGQFFPYGMKALTNAGKVRGYRVGEFLRRRYEKFLSRLYLADELVLRCTDFDRTKMTALTAMAALYPPERLQRWNPALPWQPVPYDVLPPDEDDLLYWYNCPVYLKTRNKVYSYPEIVSRVKPYADLFEVLTNHTGAQIRTPEDVFYLDNLLQAEQNVGIDPPAWAEEHMTRIKEMTKIEYDIQLYNDKLVQVAFGVLLNEILVFTDKVVRGATPLPKLHLYSAHENNVAAMMAAVRAWYPHQPNYGSTFALELRRVAATGKYAFVAVYAPEAGGAATLLPISGCGGGGYLCDYETFIDITANFTITFEELREQCFM